MLESEGSFLFILNTYNDIDHIAPLIWKCSDEKLRKTIGKNGKEKYFKYFNSNLVADFIINKTFNFNNKKKYLWHDK